MTDSDKLAISGSRRFHQAIKALYPDTSRRDISTLRDQLLVTISEHMLTGYQPAVAKRNADGSVDVVILSFEDLKGRRGK